MNTKPIAETNHYIVLDHYEKKQMQECDRDYQTEAQLEHEFIQDLQNQGYEYVKTINNQAEMAKNIRVQLESLNHIKFSENEWHQFLEKYLDNPGDNNSDKTRKLQIDSILDFTFDDGHLGNIHLIDKINLTRNKLQVIKQFEQKGSYANRYDVTILVNGLPLVQVELKKRGVSIQEAFNQIHRYSKESFNSENSFYKYLQFFVISNGTDTRYFANTIERNKNSFDFTMNWARSDNSLIRDLKDFTATFFQKNTLLAILFKYTIFDVSKNLLIMRPYQIAATERILWKINSAYNTKSWSTIHGCGYIWHTTGSGKTLTSFKAASHATELPFIDKVFFVVDRKDLDYQTMREYQKFSPDSVNGSNDTAELKRNLEKLDNKIIVTTIQKLNNLIKKEAMLPVYDKQVVFIFDECHRSQFGEAQKNIKKRFKKYYQFGFTGTPIFPENSLTSETTKAVFGAELHTYVIADAIRDDKVLKFKVDYNDVRPQFKKFETETDDKNLTAFEQKQAFLHPQRINEITTYILNNFKQKTHRNDSKGKGFNAMFAVSSVDAAKAYYEAFKKQQAERVAKDKTYKPLKVATIFSFAANEVQDAIGEIGDESFDVSALNSTAKEFLNIAIQDYNAHFNSNFNLSRENDFQNYYRDLSKKVKKQEIDLIIVVGMFLTGFDAPSLNTLFVDKNLKYHGLIQAFSRTNRILDKTKSFGNIVTFRDLEKATTDAITLFGKSNTAHVVLEKSYAEYMDGFLDALTGKSKRGFVSIVSELEQKYPNPMEIYSESEKKDFAVLFGEYLKTENILQNYDEFTALKALQKIDLNDENAVTQFKEQYYLDEDKLSKLQKVKLPSDRIIQDYKSVYNDIRDWIRREKTDENISKSTIDWDNVVFEVDLLKSQEINLDYILALISEKSKTEPSQDELIDEAKRLIRGSFENRGKEDLVVDYIKQTDLKTKVDKEIFIESFFKFANEKQLLEISELIKSEGLNEEAAKRYIATSLKHGYASENGTGLNDILPKMSPLNPAYKTKKQDVFEKIAAFVNKFKGIGYQV